MNIWKKCPKMPAAMIILCFVWAAAAALAAGAQDKPMYKVDPLWPKPLPHKWIMQQVPTLTVDKDDHIWAFNRSRQIMPDESGASTMPPRTDCCIAGPSVLEFYTDGKSSQGLGRSGLLARMASRANHQHG